MLHGAYKENIYSEDYFSFHFDVLRNFKNMQFVINDIYMH